ncbi:hypothetical protein FBU30_011233 [Linnemannia zychae]|nr:hypothetical protein FBU30_011233 [Linnemannia zychae]
MCDKAPRIWKPIMQTISYPLTLLMKKNLKECMNSGHQHEQELEMDNQNLHNNNKELAIQNKNLLNSNSNLHIQIQTLIDKEEDLLNQLESASKTNRKFLAELDQLKDINEDLEKQYDELTRKFNKKVESYKELNKNYMELVRPLRVSDDDHSTIYNRLSRIRVSIESLVQSVKSESFVIPKKDVVINFFSMYICLDAFCVEEADLDSYHISLLMESAVMSILIVQLFSRALGCIFPQSQEFENISKWVEGQDAKIATRWRQQLCILITQDSGALKCMKSHEVNQAAMILSKLFSDVHPNVDVSAKIIDLCSKSFDLAIDMFGMESRIYPVSTPLGTPFDDTTMKTPQRSNPTGTVSLDIFPSFRNDDDDDPFYIEPKVWCS